MITENNKPKNTNPDHIAQDILSEIFLFDPGWPGNKNGAYTLRWWRDDYYKWQKGRYIRVPDKEIALIVTDYLQRCDGEEEQDISVSTSKINNVLLCLSARVRIPMTQELNSWIDNRTQPAVTISMRNGFLVIDGGKSNLIEHSPHYFSLVKLPYDYDPNADCPKWLKFLDEVMQGDNEYVLLLQQWAGYLFTPGLRQHKFLLCAGPGSNGKGTFFDTIESLVGKENCSHVPLARFGHPFSLHTTLGKLLNTRSESKHIVEHESEANLKSFVAGDTLDFERKFKDPVSAKPTAKVMIATNDRPRFTDRTEGLWRRLLFVPFNKAIPEPEQIRDLADQLRAELPGILNWALEGMQKLNDAGYFTKPGRHSELLEEYRRDADPARAFLLENYQANRNGESTATAEVYRDYVEWCSTNSYKPIGARLFGRQVFTLFPGIEKRQTGSRGSQFRIYDGLGKLSNSDFIVDGAEPENDENSGFSDNIPF